jgi:hypothetical protein
MKRRWIWNAELVEAACALVRRYGSKAAAGMLGLTHESFCNAMSRRRISLVALKRGAA